MISIAWYIFSVDDDLLQDEKSKIKIDVRDCKFNQPGMKFAEHLRESSIPEWRDKYIDYSLSKKKLRAYRDALKTTSNVRFNSEYSPMQKSIIKDFIHDWLITTELEKCNEFYQQQLNSCKKKFYELNHQIALFIAQNQKDTGYDSNYGTINKVNINIKEDKFFKFWNSFISILNELDLLPSIPHSLSGTYNKKRDFYSHNRETFSVANLSIKQARQQLSDALLEFYLFIQLLKNYRDLNVTGFRKIVKKFDKSCNTNELESFMKFSKNNSVMFQHSYQNLQLVAIQLQKSNSLSQPSRDVSSNIDDDPLTFWEEKVCYWYSDTLTLSNQDRKHNIQKLRNLSLQHSLNEQMIHRTNQSVTQMFFGGIFLGISFVLATYTLYLSFTVGTNTYIHKIIFPIWSGWYLVLLMSLLFSLDCFIWYRSKINYRFIMLGEIHSKHGGVLFNNNFSMTKIPLQIYSVSVMTIMCCVFSFNSFIYGQLVPWYWLWFVFSVCLFLYPWNIGLIPYWRSIAKTKRHILISMIRLFFSGAYPVQFYDFFLGDIVCSLTYSLADLGTIICVVSGTPFLYCGSSHLRSMGVLSCFPSYWRLMQCLRRFFDSGDWFPHLLNALKYILGIFYNISLCTYRLSQHDTTYKNLFITFGFLNSIYTSVWDLVMDWSLFQIRSSNMFLRNDLYLAGKRDWKNGKYSMSRKSIYYLAMLWNVLIRFQWLVYILTPTQIQQSAVTSFILAVLEIIRRFIWAIFRVENEHVANTHLFKITGEMPLPYPISSCMNDEELENYNEVSMFHASNLMQLSEVHYSNGFNSRENTAVTDSINST